MKELIAKYKEWIKAGHDRASIAYYLEREPKKLTALEKENILNTLFKKKN